MTTILDAETNDVDNDADDKNDDGGPAGGCNSISVKEYHLQQI